MIPGITTKKISSDPGILEREHPDANFIIIDEAHYFRRPDTNRYQALRFDTTTVVSNWFTC